MDSPPDWVADAPDVVLRFDPGRPIPAEDLVQILRSATSSPSGYDLQPWRFLVVRSRRNRERLRACSRRQPVLSGAAAVIIVLGDKAPHRVALPRLLDRQVLRGKLTPQEASYRSGLLTSIMERSDAPDLWAARSASMAARGLMDAAKILGIDGAWVDGFDEPALRRAFGIPDDHVVCALIALGYATGTIPGLPRLGLDLICFDEHFGRSWQTEGREGDRRRSGGDAEPDPI